MEIGTGRYRETGGRVPFAKPRCGMEDDRGRVCVGRLFHFGDHEFKDLMATPLNNSDVVPLVNELKVSEKP